MWAWALFVGATLVVARGALHADGTTGDHRSPLRDVGHISVIRGPRRPGGGSSYKSLILNPMPQTVLMYSVGLALASLARRLEMWTFTVLSSPM